MNEFCNECGRSVAQGSGLFVNRIPDADDVKTRRENGKPFPKRDFMCRECERERIMNSIHMEKTKSARIHIEYDDCWEEMGGT